MTKVYVAVADALQLRNALRVCSDCFDGLEDLLTAGGLNGFLTLSMISSFSTAGGRVTTEFHCVRGEVVNLVSDCW